MLWFISFNAKSSLEFMANTPWVNGGGALS